MLDCGVSEETSMQPNFPNSASLLKKNLENNAAVIYVLDRDLRIVYCNEAWNRFAAENGGRGLERDSQVGRSLMDVIPLPLKQFFEENYRKALSKREIWSHSYECSSPTVYRAFRMVSYPDPEGDGVVVVNSITVERPHEDQDRKVCSPNGMLYEDEQGIVTMCCHCRRTCRVGQTAVWDWVPIYLEEPPELISHGICAVCMNLIYPRFVEG